MTIIKQGDSNSEVIIWFVTKSKLSVDLIQLLKVITVLGFTLHTSLPLTICGIVPVFFYFYQICKSITLQGSPMFCYPVHDTAY